MRPVRCFFQFLRYLTKLWMRTWEINDFCLWSKFFFGLVIQIVSPWKCTYQETECLSCTSGAFNHGVGTFFIETLEDVAYKFLLCLVKLSFGKVELSAMDLVSENVLFLEHLISKLFIENELFLFELSKVVFIAVFLIRLLLWPITMFLLLFIHASSLGFDWGKNIVFEFDRVTILSHWLSRFFLDEFSFVLRVSKSFVELWHMVF